MSFDRERMPDPVSYFEGEGLKLSGPGKWKTTGCTFHGGSDSMRINVASGAWVCMSCSAKGGDVLSYHMQAHGLEFIDAAKALGCWVDDGKPQRPHKPAPLAVRSDPALMAAAARAHPALSGLSADFHKTIRREYVAKIDPDTLAKVEDLEASILTAEGAMQAIAEDLGSLTDFETAENLKAKSSADLSA